MKIIARTTSVFLLAVICLLIGCQRSESTGDRADIPKSGVSSGSNRSLTFGEPAPRSRGDARTRLREVFRRYQGCSYYRDNAVVTLERSVPRSSSQVRSSSLVTTAPLRVELDHLRMNVDAYATRIRVDALNAADPSSNRVPIRLAAWFEEPETANFDSQVLRATWVAAPNERLHLDRVLSDEVLRSRLSAGLAGPPPQLEWLLADEPMSGLFRVDADSQDTFRWLEDAQLGDQRVQRIEVVADRDRFVFWIDPNASLIKRVEFPAPEGLPSSDAAGVEEEIHWGLKLDLNEATFQPGIQPPFQLQPNHKPVPVQAFVPIPPPPPSPLLGRRMDVRDWTSKMKSAPFCMIANAPESSSDVGSIGGFTTWYQDIANAIPALVGASQVHLVTHDRASADAVDRLPSPPIQGWNSTEVRDRLRQLRMAKGSLALLDSDGRVLLIETRTDRGAIGNVLAVMRDSVSGVDVPEKIRNDYETMLQAYQAQLRRSQIEP